MTSFKKGNEGYRSHFSGTCKTGIMNMYSFGVSSSFYIKVVSFQ